MIEGLRKIGLPVFASGIGRHRQRCHIVAIGDAIGAQHDSTDNPEIQSLYRALTEGGAVLTIRRGILRVALHLYNNEDDVQQLLDIAASWRSRVAGLTRICRANVRQ
jgi:cysteine desulfurase / selenocysteine lyase